MATFSSPSVSVSVVEVSSIAPASPSTRRHLFLSSLDIWWQDLHYNRRLLFYPDIEAFFSSSTQNGHGRGGYGADDDAIETLKRGLSAALVLYYPWAGRLALDPDRNGRLAIDCNDTGVEFIEASADVPMAEIARLGFPMLPLYDRLCREVEHTGDHLYTSPLLSIQVTRFSDGGIAVGVSQSHVVADGQSLWSFMVAWGECARKGKSGGTISTQPPPIHERERLALQGPPSEEKAKRFIEGFLKVMAVTEMGKKGKEEEEEEEEEEKEEEKEKEKEEAKGRAKKEEGAASEEGEEGASQPLVQCVLEVSGSTIQRLKAEAGGAGFSSYEAMCAHFWKRVSAARRVRAREPVVFTPIVNMRARMEPPLPAAYFGNALEFRTAGPAAAGEIAGEAIGATAGRIRAAIAASGPDSLLCSMHWLELHGNRYVELLPAFSAVAGMSVASSPRFPAYAVDFGFGRPAAVRSARVPGNGEMVLFGGRPGSEPGSVEICLALPPPVMRRLLLDPAFLASPISDPFLYYP